MRSTRTCRFLVRTDRTLNYWRKSTIWEWGCVSYRATLKTDSFNCRNWVERVSLPPSRWVVVMTVFPRISTVRVVNWWKIVQKSHFSRGACSRDTGWRSVWRLSRAVARKVLTPWWSNRQIICISSRRERKWRSYDVCCSKKKRL